MDMLIEVVVVSICIHMNPNIGKCGVAAAATARSHFKWELSLLSFLSRWTMRHSGRQSVRQTADEPPLLRRCFTSIFSTLPTHWLLIWQHYKRETLSRRRRVREDAAAKDGRKFALWQCSVCCVTHSHTITTSGNKKVSDRGFYLNHSATAISQVAGWIRSLSSALCWSSTSRCELDSAAAVNEVDHYLLLRLIFSKASFICHIEVSRELGVFRLL